MLPPTLPCSVSLSLFHTCLYLFLSHFHHFPSFLNFPPTPFQNPPLPLSVIATSKYCYVLHPSIHSNIPCIGMYCYQGGSLKVSLSHFLSTCLKFHHARSLGLLLTIKSVRFWQHLFISIWQLIGLFTVNYAQSDRAGLRFLEVVPTAIVLQSGWFRHCSITNESWKMATWFYGNILPHEENCIRSRNSDQRYADSLIHVLKTCVRLKLDAADIQTYLNSTSKIHCLRMDTAGPSIGCGHSGTCAWTVITWYSEIPWSSIVRLASVEALAFMCRLHCCPSLQNQPLILLIKSPTWQCMQPIKDLAESTKPSWFSMRKV